ncbi:MAG: AAA family ATPase [Candidatus Roizmanbacteria bacterium]|nr:AAA family ATPase [Candidatus Roizmanbacteria bacterium]
MRSLINLFIFIPYYFNVKTHLQNLFFPWKRIVVTHQSVLERMIGNMASRGIGFILRLSVVFAAFCILMVYIVLFPVLVILVMMLAPLRGLAAVLFPKVHRIQKEREQFVNAHCLDKQNRAAVITWFEQAYVARQKEHDRFSLTNLLSTVPIGHDWNYGFTPLLDQYGTTLTGFGVMGGGLSDREEEIAALTRELSRSYESNAVLVGEEGVGKHTIINGLAQRIHESRVIGLLQQFRMVVVSMDRILASSSEYAQQVELLSQIMEEARLARNIILVIDNIHLYTSTALQGDFSDIFTRYATLPQLKLLGITTPFYFQQVLFHNASLQELFHKVDVHEMNKERVMRILQEKALLLEHSYDCVITYETLQRVIERSTYYITHIPFPEKAIDLLHEAASLTKAHQGKTCTPQDVDDVLQAKTHMPVGLLSTDFKTKLKSLPDYLQTHILGQQEAMSSISMAAQRAFIEENRKKPKLSLLLLGPTGVGKTETAKLLATIFFGSRSKMIRLDMSFYQRRERLADLIGSFENKQVGMLAQYIREHPFSVLLIDELEKADPEILNVFLTLLDEGYMMDGFGKKIDGKNLLVIATSNAASKEVFPPELLARFDEVLTFQPLTLETAQQIGKELAQRLKTEYEQTKHITLELSEPELREVIKKAFDPRFGAREVKRAVEGYIVGKVAQKVL